MAPVMMLPAMSVIRTTLMNTNAEMRTSGRFNRLETSSAIDRVPSVFEVDHLEHDEVPDEPPNGSADHDRQKYRLVPDITVIVRSPEVQPQEQQDRYDRQAVCRD